MKSSRRDFLLLSCKTIAVIGAGNLLQSFSPSAFKMPSAKDVRLRFAIASDAHYGQPNTPYDQFHEQMIDWLNTEKEQRGLDFVCLNGDLIHDKPEFLSVMKQKLNRLQSPLHVTHGNHDMIAETEWEKLFGTKWHYSFRRGNCAFLLLNTADEKGKYICPDLEWTAKELRKLSGVNDLFVFMHITPKKWTGAGIDCPELLQMFSNQKNLRMTFHGHDHNEDNVKVHGDMPFFFDSHIGGSWGTDYRGYRIVEVLKNGEIVTYQMNPADQRQVNQNRLKKGSMIS